MDLRVCVRCGSTLVRGADERPKAWAQRRYCSVSCYRDRDPEALADRFWRHVDKSGDCWVWTAARVAGGYGTFGLDRETMARAHRVSFELANGPIPVGMAVMHRCDNPPCVRPDHLELGSWAANNADRDAKGRRVAGPSLGSANGNAKLSDDQVRSIRARRASGERTVDLAPEFGVTPTLISRIALRKAWRHLT